MYGRLRTLLKTVADDVADGVTNKLRADGLTLEALRAACEEQVGMAAENAATRVAGDESARATIVNAVANELRAQPGLLIERVKPPWQRYLLLIGLPVIAGACVMLLRPPSEELTALLVGLAGVGVGVAALVEKRPYRDYALSGAAGFLVGVLSIATVAISQHAVDAAREKTARDIACTDRVYRQVVPGEHADRVQRQRVRQLQQVAAILCGA